MLDLRRSLGIAGLAIMAAATLAPWTRTAIALPASSAPVRLAQTIPPASTPSLPANSSVELRQLQQLLQAKNWAAANQETLRILFIDSDPFGPDLKKIPLETLRAIDQAWVSASNGRFGLSVQAKLWREVSAKYPKNQEAAINAFRDRVGWKIPAPRKETDFISSDWRNESELTYSLQAPQGHLPWAGVPDKLVQSVAIPPEGQHCGSCTIDAMQLRNGRFYGYIPALFTRVQLALQPPPTTPVPVSSLLQGFNLAALYPVGSTIRPMQMVLSPNGQLLAVASSAVLPERSTRHTLAVWDLVKGSRRVTLLPATPGQPQATAIAFSADSQQVLAGLANGTVQVWDSSTGRSLRSWSAHTGPVESLGVSGDGLRVLSTGSDRVMKVWEGATGKLLQTVAWTPTTQPR